MAAIDSCDSVRPNDCRDEILRLRRDAATWHQPQLTAYTKSLDNDGSQHPLVIKRSISARVEETYIQPLICQQSAKR